jgi:hypothetical protein
VLEALREQNEQGGYNVRFYFSLQRLESRAIDVAFSSLAEAVEFWIPGTPEKEDGVEKHREGREGTNQGEVKAYGLKEDEPTKLQLVIDVVEKVDPAYHRGVSVFLSMLRNSAEYKGPGRARLELKVQEVLRLVADDESVREDIVLRMVDSVDRCSDKVLQMKAWLEQNLD